jgi:acyl-CoA reductase-like NAD-dependent aldehyde dehydrogenase
VHYCDAGDDCGATTTGGTGMTGDIYQYGTYANGEWIGTGSDTFETFDPARPGNVVGRYRVSTPEDINATIRAAVRAQREWAAVPGLERQYLVGRYFTKLRESTEAIAVAITREMGKPIGDARGEVGWSLVESEFMLGEAARSLGSVMPSWRRDVQNLIMRRPRGVIAAVSPWNYPFLTPMRKVAPALVFGNAIVLKPSEYTPAAACMMAELTKGILPDGLFGIVNGRGAAGQSLVSHPRINGVTFTGSVPTGKAIYQAAAANLAEVSLELGGKNPIVVHDVRDLEACLDEIARGAMQNGGQRCTSLSRVIVRRPLAKDVEAGLAERLSKVIVGEGFDPKAQIGPMAMRAQHDKVLSMIDMGVREGAKIGAGGGRAAPSGFEQGYFVQPTLLCGVSPTMRIAREEIFGPVLSVIPFDDIDEALGIVNDVEFGLAACLYSEDAWVTRRFTEQAEAGMLHVNHQTAGDPNMPFIGAKTSGVGAGSVGASAATFYTSEHSVYLKTLPPSK